MEMAARAPGFSASACSDDYALPRWPVARDELWAQLASKPYVKGVREQGRFALWWLRGHPNYTGTQWGIRATPSSRGLSLMDINAADGVLVEPACEKKDIIRGETFLPGFPYLQKEWIYNAKYEVWAANVCSLYEEGVERQWSATRDIPWAKQERLPDDLESAMCQFCTFLTGGELQAEDVLAKFIPLVNQYYHEPKLFLALQCLDEARHLEVFRKRCLSNGGGIGVAPPVLFNTTSLIDMAGDFTTASYAIHLVFEGIFLQVFRAGEFIGQTEVDKAIFRRVMQDEARHVSYGTMHLKFYLENHPDRTQAEEHLHAIADGTELIFLNNFFTTPDIIEPLAVLFGGGVRHVDTGLERLRIWWRQVREDYLRRCDRAGFNRRERCLFPEDHFFFMA